MTTIHALQVSADKQSQNRELLIEGAGCASCVLKIETALRNVAGVAHAELGVRSWSRDRTDDVFIHTVLAAKVSRLITGDQDLLILRPLGDLHLLTPRAALDEIASMQAPAKVDL